MDLNTQAQSFRANGRFTDAASALTACMSASCPQIVRDDCTKRMDELHNAQPTFIFSATNNGQDVVDVKVTMDGQPLADNLAGQALLVDPGDHTFSFTKEGLPPVTRRFVVRESDKGRRESIAFGTSPAAPTNAAPNLVVQAAPALGHLIIKTSVPAKVFIDGGERGASPLDSGAFPAGIHTVRVEFDDGGSTTRRVTVTANETTKVDLEPSAAGQVFPFRRGLHLGATLEGTVFTAGSSITGIGGRLTPFVNFGASPGVEFRVGPTLGIGEFTSGDGQLYLQLGAIASLRGNIGSFYVISFGVTGGVIEAVSLVNPYVLGEISPVTIRFGSEREFELGYTFGVGVLAVADSGGLSGTATEFQPLIENLVGFTYVLPQLF